MRVMLLAAGDSIHTIKWANGLTEIGLSVTLATQQPLIEGLSGAVAVHRLRHSGQLGYFLNAPAVRRILKEDRVDLLNAHYASGYGTTARLVRFRPTLLSVWGADVYDFPETTRLHKLWLRGNLAAADRIASTSHVMGQQVQRIAPEILDIAVTPFGVDTERFAPELGMAPVEDGPIIIGTIKTLTHKYGIDTLIDSVALAIERLRIAAPAIADRVRLRIIGDGPLNAVLRQQATDRGIGAITEFVGHIPHAQVPQELRRMHIYAALSRLDSESFGVAIVEAGACGLPVVVSNVGGLPEVVDNRRTGLVVPKENPQAAADALVRLVVDRELGRKMGRQARERVLSLYRWEDNVRTMADLYRSMIRGADDPSSGNDLARSVDRAPSAGWTAR